MALTRAFLKSMSLTEEQVTAIIEEHVNSTDAIKAQEAAVEKDLADLNFSLTTMLTQGEGMLAFCSQYKILASLPGTKFTKRSRALPCTSPDNALQFYHQEVSGMNETLKTVESMFASELGSKLQHSYDQSIADDCRPMGEAFGALEQEQAARYSDELQAALAEYDEMKRSPGSYKRYESFDALLDEVFAHKKKEKAEYFKKKGFTMENWQKNMTNSCFIFMMTQLRRLKNQ